MITLESIQFSEFRSIESIQGFRGHRFVAMRSPEVLEARNAARNLEPLVEGGDKQEDENGDNYEGENRGRNGNRNGNGNEGVNGNGNDNGNGGVNGNGNGGGNGNGNGNGNGGGNGYGNHNVNFRGFMPVARECTFQDFLKCQPLNFNGMEGVVGLTCWFDKMETGNDFTAYNRRFQELVLLCTRMVPDEEDKVERFIGGLPNNIQGNVIAVEPTRLQDAIRIANNLKDKKLKGYARNAKSKRKFDNNPRDNRGQQPSFKRKNVGDQNVSRAYTAENNEKKGALVGNQSSVICYECGRPGHYKKDYPKLRNQNRRNNTRNKTGNNEATTRAYAIRGGGANLDSNVIMGTFLLKNYYASMLFNSGVDRSFVSSTFNALLDVTPSTLDTSYAIELTMGECQKPMLSLDAVR
ncbi:reverse transcriptase domain-containing protein [Tanacetum coccineum]